MFTSDLKEICRKSSKNHFSIKYFLEITFARVISHEWYMQVVTYPLIIIETASNPIVEYQSYICELVRT